MFRKVMVDNKTFWQIRWLHSPGHLLCSNHPEERQRRTETTSVTAHFLFNSLQILSFPFSFYALPACTVLCSHLISPPLSFILLLLLMSLHLSFLSCLPPSRSLYFCLSNAFFLSQPALFMLCNRQKNVLHALYESFYLFHRSGNGAAV